MIETTDTFLAAIDLDRDGPRRRSRVLESAVRAAIADRVIGPGAPLPSTRELAARLGTSRGVAVRAYAQLEAEGVLVATHGDGTYVADVVRTSDGRPPVAIPPLPAFGPRNPGRVDPNLVPRGALADALGRAARQLPNAALGYGDPRGMPRLRSSLATWLARTRAVTVDPEQVVVTSGWSQALALLARALSTRPGVVAVEDPGSPAASQLLRWHGVTTTPVSVDEHGIRVADLPDRGVVAALVTPAHQFPTGAVLSPERRRELVAWARRANAYVLEDDYDRELRHAVAPVASLHGLAPSRVVHGGSVSKLLSPAMRVGWAVVPPRLLPAVVEAKYWADVGTSALLQGALALLLDEGTLDRATRRAAAAYARRRDALREVVASDLPGWRVTGDAAGLHAVLRTDDPDEESAVAAAVAALGPSLGLVVERLAMFTEPGGSSEPVSGLVVGYGHVSADRVRRDVVRIAGHRRR